MTHPLAGQTNPREVELHAIANRLLRELKEDHPDLNAHEIAWVLNEARVIGSIDIARQQRPRIVNYGGQQVVYAPNERIRQLEERQAEKNRMVIELLAKFGRPPIDSQDQGV